MRFQNKKKTIVYETSNGWEVQSYEIWEAGGWEAGGFLKTLGPAQSDGLLCLDARSDR